MNHVLLTNILCLGWINAQRERGWPHWAETGERDDGTSVSASWHQGLLSTGPPLAQITQAFPGPELPLPSQSQPAQTLRGECLQNHGDNVPWPVTWAIAMTTRHQTHIRLLVTLGAALPFTQDPVFTWTASLACGHFLGHLFRHLAGAGHQDDHHPHHEAEDHTHEEARDEDGASAENQEQVAATPAQSSRPDPCQRQQQRPHENTPRGRLVRNTRQRMQDKRQKHLRKGSFQKLGNKNSSSGPEEPVPSDQRGTRPVTEDRLLSEAARTLDNICSDYLCSLERKKVTDNWLSKRFR